VAMGQACSYTQVAAGDGCWSLAQRCGITQDQFVQYNGADICSKLQPRQYHVCCSTGPLPDFSPKPNADGSCFSYTIKKDDTCWDISQAYYVTSDQIEERNTKTWGWLGCSKLTVGNNICLSTGSPPMPAPLDKAACGPQVPGTPRPANMDDLANLNPCPLNACCNVWGQCGIDENFCIPSPVPGGAPGTATPGSNGCIANCGLEIVGNDSPPSEYKRIGYWEGWNADRPCLNMRHFAFGNITTDYHVDVSGLQSAYNDFKALTGVKRIMSFGGWTFSTEWDTYPIFREGVTPEQRYAFAQNVVNFIVSEGLDGVDFDWEYPGAPDIPDIPPASKQNGENYLDFLRNVRQLLPSQLTIGIAAPASFWYLKGFPLAEMAKVVDYIVYMTYDLHGQWDYDNQWTSPGCPKGDCLRSHVNKTETELALVMATKAGAPAHKIIVGMPMYGRSFKMTQPGCWGPDCHFVGPKSGAAKGRCTGTSGYISNFEIREIIATNPNMEVHTDDNGDILVYNGDQWVSWLSKSSYEARENWIKGLNFGGTSDWAIDLDVDYGPNTGSPGGSPGGGAGGDSGSGPILISPDIYNSPDPAPEVRCHPPCTLVFPPWQLSTTTTISMDPVTVAYSENWEVTTTVNGAPVTTSTGTVTSTVITVPPVTTTEIPLWNYHWDGRDDGGDDEGLIIYLTSSIVFPPVTLTRTRPPVPGNTKTEIIVWTYSPGPFPTLTPNPVGEDDDDDDDGVVVIIPPGPPPGHKGMVTVKDGEDGPKCGPGQKCGVQCNSLCDSSSIPCLFLCGCVGPFCKSGSCVGPGCFDRGHTGGGGGSGNPNDPDESSCRTRTTVSDCEVECSVLSFGGDVRTTCEDPTCDYPVTACSATGTTTTTTTTRSCRERPAYTPNFGIPVLGGGGVGGTWDYGEGNVDPTTSSATPRTTTQSPNPTPTTVPPGGACGADQDCRNVACDVGTSPGCLSHGGGAPATCACFNLEVPLGGACSQDEQCQHNDCSDGTHPGCLSHGVGLPGQCVCGFAD
ncbi:hypothetical protein C8A03DRAFT_16799, partial [Achaetomium macrosporum]